MQVVATALHALADSYEVYFVLDASPRSREGASAVVLALVDGLNRLDGRHGGMFDTIRREEACGAILDLARLHLFSALTPEETQELIDSRREF